jgi:hypothetical protein
MRRIHLPNTGPDTEKISVAFALGLKEAQNLGCAEIALITPVKDNLDAIVVGEFLGQEASRKLMKGHAIPIGQSGVSIIHGSVASIQKEKISSVGIAFYVSSADIKKLDALLFSSLIYVPWLGTDGTEWAARWAAETIGEHSVNTSINLPAEVADSLKQLTTCVNLSTGLGHPSDLQHAKRRFAELKGNGISWIPSDVESWAARNGWRPADAEELAKLSARYI